MNKVLEKVASGVVSAVVIMVGVKIIYNELPKGARESLNKKSKKVYEAITCREDKIF